MSHLWLWLIINISLIQARYIRLPTVNSSELSPIGTPIIQLLDVLPSSNWEFTFLTQISIKSYFLLDNLKGTIIIKRHLDREDLCQLNYCSCLNECLLKLEINAISDTSTHILSLPILIIDENDNYCYFLNDIYYLNITENVRINTRISLPLAYDPDLTPNNIQSYYLLENNYSEFRLENQLTPSIIILESLDRELYEKYYFIFCAFEGINEQKRSCCTKIIIRIIDVNDNSPKFQHNQRLPLIINVSELSPIGTEVIQMKAFDPDEGLNGKIQYRFSKWTLNDQTIDEIFNLNLENGSIILLKQLDYEKRTNYELQIQAKDLGLNAIPTYSTVIIQVIDENDCIPEIFIFSSPDVQLINNSLIYIFENITLHTPILYLTISDGDTNENGRVTVDLISLNSILQLEKLNNNTYILLTNIIFDREEISSYSFSLITYDHGKPIHSIINKFNLYLIDINDCFPFFDTTTNYSFNIDENNKENLIIQTIQTFDLDQNDFITLNLEFKNEEEKNLFQINQQNQLIITKSLDYEYQSFYNFILNAEDSVGHRTSIPVSIHLNDLNDNSVKFRTNFTQLNLEENQPIGTIFSQIQAEDKDKNDKIIYEIHPNDLNHIENLIELNSNGSLYTKRRFNREEITKFQFHIIANDSLHTDLILIEILIENKSILKTQSPYCLIGNQNESIRIQFEAYKNVSFLMRNPSSDDLILFPNGTLIVKFNLKKYSFDIYLCDENSLLIFENFILLSQSQCKNNVLIQFDQQIIFICLICFIIIIIIIICFYFQQQTQKKSLEKKPNLTPSFSSLFNDTLLFSSPSPQFTAMTTISSSTREQTNKSSSLSNSSSSTYIKMSRSLEDEMI